MSANPPSTTNPPANPLSSVLNAVTAFLGSADVQKILGLTLSGDAALEWKSLSMKLTGMTVGGAFTLAIHVVDAIRAKIGR